MSTGLTEFVGAGPLTYEGNPSIMVRIDFTTCDGPCLREEHFSVDDPLWASPDPHAAMLDTVRAKAVVQIETSAIRRLLWGGVADQTWCICIGDKAGEHLQIIDGWTKYKHLDENQALDVAAAELHEVGFRAGMSVDELPRPPRGPWSAGASLLPH